MKSQNPSFAKKIVIFASGTGTNTENIINYFNPRDHVKVVHVLSNNKSAKVLQKAHELEVSALYFDKAALYDTKEVLNILKDTNPDLIVLAGFLWMLPKHILQNFPNKIINIHPALLPKYGGKGMYGMRVHQAVVENKDLKSGITIHYVNEHYDEGEIIAQFETELSPNETAEQIAAKIHQLEHEHFPRVIENLLFPEE
ncbi:MAG TPA: phosphoribosylglycinamide formyltransferase [Flavobacteriaceae bacterium]|nr:phosphoribosylglycinamide formyltransferase [Flavobacteriaceae bacterium]